MFVCVGVCACGFVCVACVRTCSCVWVCVGGGRGDCTFVWVLDVPTYTYKSLRQPLSFAIYQPSTTVMDTLP